MEQKKNFKIDERVKIFNTTDVYLDNHYGTILGKSVCNIVDFYIVLLDTPYQGGNENKGAKAIVLIESCLEKVI